MVGSGPDCTTISFVTVLGGRAHLGHPWLRFEFYQYNSGPRLRYYPGSGVDLESHQRRRR